jgi:hypothetical protein
MLERFLLRLRVLFGYVPNVEWMLAAINRAVVLDRARAHAATAELERCLLLRRTGGRCPRLGGVLR